MTDLHWFWLARGAGDVHKITGFGCDATGRPSTVRRMGLSSSGDLSLEREFEGLSSVVQYGPHPFSLPKPVRKQQMGHVILEMPLLPGTSIWEQLRALPRFERATVGWHLVRRLIQILEASELGDARPFDADQNILNLRMLVQKATETESQRATVHRALADVEQDLRDVWRQLGTHRPAHGDFWFGNVLKDRNAFAVLDWEYYGYYPTPFFDHLTLITSSSVVLSPKGDGTLSRAVDWTTISRALDDNEIPSLSRLLGRPQKTLHALLLGTALTLAARERDRQTDGNQLLWSELLTSIVMHLDQTKHN